MRSGAAGGALMLAAIMPYFCRGCTLAGLAFVVSSMTACSPDVLVAPTGISPLPPHPEAPLSPPAEYAQYFRETETCSGLRGDFAKLRFAIVNPDDSTRVQFLLNPSFLEYGSAYTTNYADGSATIHLTRLSARDPLVVRGAMLLALQRSASRAAFAGPCAAIVHSTDADYELAGRRPPTRIGVHILISDAFPWTPSLTFGWPEDAIGNPLTLMPFAPRGTRACIRDAATHADIVCGKTTTAGLLAPASFPSDVDWSWVQAARLTDGTYELAVQAQLDKATPWVTSSFVVDATRFWERGWANLFFVAGRNGAPRMAP